MEIGGYRIVGELGRGGMGVVYEALDPRTRQRVALKTVGLAGAGVPLRGLERLQREAEALARLSHPGLVPYSGFGVGPRGFYLAMGLVEGTSLEELLQRGGPLPLGRALQLMADVGEALAYVHRQGLLHRDVKPANLLLSTSGRVVLTDFGLVKLSPELQAASQASLTRTGAMLGTPGYWPPEQAFGKLQQVGPASDVYGWAATLYALLGGQPPRTERTVVELLEAFENPPLALRQLRPEVPGWLDQLLLRCLATEPEARPTLAEALEELRSFGRETGGGRRGQQALLGGLAALALAGVLGLGWVLLREDATPEPPRGVATAERSDEPNEPADAPPQKKVSQERETFLEFVEAQDLEGAERFVREWNARSPTAEAACTLVEVCLYGRRMDEALRLAERAVSDHPSSAACWGVQAQVLVRLRRFKEAIPSAERSVELDPRDRYGVTALATALTEDEQHTRALEAWTRLIEHSPKAAYYAERARVYDGLEQLELTQRDLAQALELDPDCPTALGWRGHVKLRHLDDPSGSADLLRALRLPTHHDPARHFEDLSDSLLEQGRAQELLDVVEHWFPLPTEDARVAEPKVRALIQLRRHAEALPLIETLLRVAPCPMYLLYRGMCLAAVGRIEDALRDYEQVYASADPKTDPAYLDAARRAAAHATAMNFPERGLRAAELWLALEPESLDGRLIRLDAWAKLGRDLEQIQAEVDDLLRRVGAQDPDSLSWVYSCQATALAGAGRTAEAVASFTRSLAIAPSMWCFGERGRLLLELGELAHAEGDLLRALQFSPRAVEPWYWLMRVWTGQDRLALAVFAGEHLQRLDPKHPFSRDAAKVLQAWGR